MRNNVMRIITSILKVWKARFSRKIDAAHCLWTLFVLPGIVDNWRRFSAYSALTHNGQHILASWRFQRNEKCHLLASQNGPFGQTISRLFCFVSTSLLEIRRQTNYTEKSNVFGWNDQREVSAKEMEKSYKFQERNTEYTTFFLMIHLRRWRYSQHSLKYRIVWSLFKYQIHLRKWCEVAETQISKLRMSVQREHIAPMRQKEKTALCQRNWNIALSAFIHIIVCVACSSNNRQCLRQQHNIASFHLSLHSRFVYYNRVRYGFSLCSIAHKHHTSNVFNGN